MRAILKSLRFLSPSRRLASKRKRGQTLVEYSLILAVLTVLMVGVLSVFSDRIIMIFSGIDAILDTAQGS